MKESDIIAKKILASLSGLPVESSKDAMIKEIIFGRNIPMKKQMENAIRIRGDIMNDFDSYMAMREEAPRFFNDLFKRIFDTAFENVQNSIIFMFDHHYATKDKNGELNIYTNHPGVLIGVSGKNIDKLKELLKEEFGHDYDVKIHEVGHYYYKKVFINSSYVE